MKRNYIALLVIAVLASCVNNDRNKIYKDGEFTYSQYRIGNNSKDTMRTFYDADGNISEIAVFKNGKKDGGYYFFSPNGDIQKVLYYYNGLKINNGEYFDENCKLSYIAKYDSNFQVQHITFDDPNVKAELNSSVVIKNSGSFVTVDPNADTIVLGETYSARVVLNFPKKNYDCNIYTLDKIQKADSIKEWTLLENGNEATYKDTPKETGEHKYEIDVVQLKIYPTHRDTVKDSHEIKFSVKYFVKSK